MFIKMSQYMSFPDLCSLLFCTNDLKAMWMDAWKKSCLVICLLALEFQQQIVISYMCVYLRNIFLKPNMYTALHL